MYRNKQTVLYASSFLQDLSPFPSPKEKKKKIVLILEFFDMSVLKDIGLNGFNPVIFSLREDIGMKWVIRREIGVRDMF